ncbi:hypothetical protein RVR_8288 [Actinacidiphila reveromycinica]|uniref:Uncharacterized protein n=1 Tax=Actinacidiphila reveromycinica TaxID=659352 RepID=A0A7U3UYB2_9ACTN|nr:hypothetical protein [Streptomyces sp. SN-593]BBB01052.1 hypothetical protein RVR_8288 [Streptomyces sp. SN-593]
MPITPLTKPTYALDCDRCGIPAEHDDGTPTLFESEDAARAWARDNGWTVGDELLCTQDAIDAANQREHDEEIAAAIQYAMGDQP